MTLSCFVSISFSAIEWDYSAPAFRSCVRTRGVTGGKQHRPAKPRPATMLLREFVSLLRIAAVAAGLPGSICLPQGRFRPFLSLAARLSPDDPCVPGPEGQERRDVKKTPLSGLQGSWDAPELTAPSSERLFPRGRVRRCLCTVLRSAVSGPSSLCELIQRKTSGVKRSGGESEIGSSAHRVSVNQTRPLVLVKRDWDSIEQMVFFFFFP